MRGFRFLLSLIVVGTIATVVCSDDSTEAEVKLPFTVKFVDQDGKPVEGVKAGITAFYYKEEDLLPIVDGTGWQFEEGTTSNAEGLATFPDGANEEYLCVVARHPLRHLIAVWKIQPKLLDAAKSKETVSISMFPECRVSGRITSTDLIKHNLPVDGANLYLNAAGTRAFFYQSEDLNYHFFVPPGDYAIDAFSVVLHSFEKRFTVSPGQRELILETIDLPAKRFALLTGQPAPELGTVEAWKNGPAIEPDRLKGKCVILEFWGYWCGPCVHGMPELFKLHDKYHDDGLEIVGIHVDLGEDEKDPVDTVAKLDRRLTQIRRDLWKGRDIPFPVALVSGERTSHTESTTTKKARSSISARYGIDGYPTSILIDRKGNIVKVFNPNEPDHIELLEKLLAEK